MPAESEGVYVDLQELIRLKHQGQGFSFLPRQPVHSLLAGQKASKLRGRGLNFEEIREYLTGDDIRSMDWKVTARMRKPHTRVYTEERDRPTLLVVDQRMSMFFGSQNALKSVIAAQVAALAAWRVVGVGDRVGALVFNDTDIDEVRPHRSNRTVMRILDVLVSKNHALKASNPPKSNPGQLNEVLKLACRLAQHDTLVCMISDFEGSDELTQKLLTRLVQHNDVLAGMVFDPLEADLPKGGQLVVGDGELQLEFDSEDPELRNRYLTAGTARREQLQSFLMTRQIPLLPLHTGASVAHQIRQHLGYRTKRVSQ